MTEYRDKGLSTLAIIQTREAQIAQLRAALEIVPARMLLNAGQPYTIRFTEEELKQIAAALEMEIS